MRATSLDSFFRRPNPAVRAILICGFDEMAVSDAGRQAVAALRGKNASDVEFVELDERVIASDPGRLADEVQSYSLLGGRRIIHVRSADAGFVKAVAPLLKTPTSGNLILAEAVGLRKTSPLRVLFEEAETALCCALPDETDESALAIIDKVMRQAGLTIGDEAKHRVVEGTGKSSALVRLEAEKLALYCSGKGTVAVADVEAVCGGGDEPAVDDLVLASFAGAVSDSDQNFHQLLRSGEDAGRIAVAAHQHALRLIDLRRDIERGMSPDQAVRSARPPIFFKLQEPMMDELRTWQLESLLGVAASLAGAVRDGRSNPGLASAIAGRALLSVARKARQLRSERS